jgi:hypothetical protein
MPAVTRTQLDRWRDDVRALNRDEARPDYAADPARFATEALGFTLDPWQRDVLEGDWSRALLNVSRQAGKSTTAAVLGLFEALYRPGSLTIIVSPSDRQSAELFRKIVELRAQLPRQQVPLVDDTKRGMSVAGGGRVVSLPGSEATVRGFSAATLIVEDEASRVPDELYQAVRPMLATTDGRLLLMSTPAGKRGHFYNAWSEGGSVWMRVRVPATEIPRIRASFLAEERAALGDWVYRQEYACEFVETDDVFFRDDDIRAAITTDVKPLFGGKAC